MNWKTLRSKKWFKFATNIYVLVLTLFVIWMVFFDANSYRIHNRLQREIDKLEEQKGFYKNRLKKMKPC